MPTVTRLIQSYGVFRPPAESYNSRRFVLRSDVIRNPVSPYRSKKTQPDVSFYGYLTVVRDGYIVDKIGIEFEHQELYSENLLTELLNFERLWRCRFPDGINFLKGLINASEPDFSLLPTGVFTSLRPNVDEFRVRLLTEDVQIKLTLLWESLFECPDDDPQQDPPPPEFPPLIPDGENPPLPSDNGDFNSLIDPPYDGADDDDRTFVTDEPAIPGCWKTYTTYSGLAPTTDYTYGLSTDVPVLVLPSGGFWWQLRNGSVSGRLMRDNWVSISNPPTLISAVWQPVCETEEIYGIPP